MTDAVFANQPPVLSAPRRLRLPNRRRAFALALGGALLLAAVVVAGLMAGPAAQATDFAASCACLTVSAELMSGFGAPDLTAMPIGDFTRSTRLSATTLPCLIRSPSA